MVAVGTAEHVVGVSAVRAVVKLNGFLFFSGFASVHSFGRVLLISIIRRPAVVAVTVSITEASIRIIALVVFIGITLRSTLVWEASASGIVRVPLCRVIVRPREMAALAVFAAKLNVI